MTTALVPTPEHHVANKFKAYFLTGLLVLVPISLTVYIIYELFLAIDGILKEVIFVLISEWFGVHISQPIPGLGFITLFLLILSTGMAARSYFGKKLVDVGDNVVARIPFISRIYGTVQQVSQAFFGDRHDVFKKTVLVPFPSKGMWRLGFIVREPSREIKEALGEQVEVVAVLVPHTPNPTSGFLVFFPKSEVVEVDMPVEDALHLIISGGTASPKNRKPPHMMLTRDNVETLHKKTS
jgi:uncharacterized membrane protein